MTYQEWSAAYPQAAHALTGVFTADVPKLQRSAEDGSESQAQQQVRLKVRAAGGYSWRNNVGCTPAGCESCGAQRRPVRYGLANDSHALNANIKSSDLILAIPRVVTQGMVGTTIAQFGGVETKRPGWKYTGTKRELGQKAWLALVTSLGGYATFSTGEISL